MQILDFIRNVEDIPTLPAVAAQINQEVMKENLTANSLAEIIKSDPSLAVKVLRLANSAYYGLSRKVDTLDRAITILGFNTVKNIALTVSVFKVFNKTQQTTINMEDLWHHSLGCAVASKAIANHNDPSLAEHAFLGGIVHDIGKIAVAHTMPAETMIVLGKLRESDAPQDEIEKEILGFTHQEIGYHLAEKWNFPELYCKAIQFHHTPLSLQTTENHSETILVRSVYVGDQIAKAMSLGKSTDPRPAKISPETWEELKIDREKIAAFREMIKTDYTHIMQHWEIQ